jgi:hypothetical protein
MRERGLVASGAMRSVGLVQRLQLELGLESGHEGVVAAQRFVAAAVEVGGGEVALQHVLSEIFAVEQPDQQICGIAVPVLLGELVGSRQRRPVPGAPQRLPFQLEPRLDSIGAVAADTVEERSAVAVAGLGPAALRHRLSERGDIGADRPAHPLRLDLEVGGVGESLGAAQQLTQVDLSGAVEAVGPEQEGEPLAGHPALGIGEVAEQ